MRYSNAINGGKMRKKYWKRNNNKALFYILRIIISIIISFASIELGIVGGNVLSNMDSKLIRNIDAENFKQFLNQSLPIINTIYNSGDVNMTFSGEVKNLAIKLFDIDLDSPITILNANSSVLYSYYNKDYQTLLARRNKEEKEKDTGDSNIIEKDANEGNKGNEGKEAASSISSEDSNEKRNTTDETIISNENGKITVQNETRYKVNIDELLKEPLKIKFDKKGPKVLIYHTHTTESYLKNLSDLNNRNVSVRTDDPVYNVVRVGDELAQNLRKKYGIDVIHNGTIHNYPSDIGAYGRSLSTIGKILKSYPSIKITLDIHRDGMSDDEKLRAVSTINKRNAAQVMFVIGTDATGLNHPNWRENLKLALRLQQKLDEFSPGLAKPIYISKNRYNEHVTNGSLLIEIGGDGNLLSEAIESTKYLSRAINEIVNYK